MKQAEWKHKNKNSENNKNGKIFKKKWNNRGRITKMYHEFHKKTHTRKKGSLDDSSGGNMEMQIQNLSHHVAEKRYP